jgi:hypothetical protein
MSYCHGPAQAVFRIGPDSRGAASGVLMRGRQEWFGQVAITDRRQEKIRQDDKAKKRKQVWLPLVDESAVGMALHASLSGTRLKTHSVAVTHYY